MNKSYRQGQILNLIHGREIYTQDELAEALAERCDIHATQVTLSRDIRELGLVKTQHGYRQITAPSGPELASIAGEFLWDVRLAQNLLVLKTSPAHASSVAVAIDQEERPEVVGTIAGDDTILVITPDNESAIRLREHLLHYLRSS